MSLYPCMLPVLVYAPQASQTGVFKPFQSAISVNMPIPRLLTVSGCPATETNFGNLNYMA
jgi:hypothetical protein